MLVCLHTYYKEVNRMPKDKKEFGDFLREIIKQTGISQSSFYSTVGITKPYFYDILSGKANPPPPDIQYKMLECLKITERFSNNVKLRVSNIFHRRFALMPRRQPLSFKESGAKNVGNLSDRFPTPLPNGQRVCPTLWNPGNLSGSPC